MLFLRMRARGRRSLLRWIRRILRTSRPCPWRRLGRFRGFIALLIRLGGAFRWLRFALALGAALPALRIRLRASRLLLLRVGVTAALLRALCLLRLR